MKAVFDILKLSNLYVVGFSLLTGESGVTREGTAREHSQNLKPRAKGRISLLGTEVRKTPKGVTTNY